MASPPSPTINDLRLALALALVKARSTECASRQHWKKKAKSRKKELQTLRKMLQQQQCDSAVSGILPLPGSCKCSFFQSSEKIFETTLMDVQQNDIDQLLFRQFLRNVNRWNYSNDCQTNMWATGGFNLDKKNQLSITCKFIAELVRKQNPGAIDGGCLAAYAHQAVDFLQGILGHILRDHRHDKLAAEGTITELASQLLEMMLSYSCKNGVVSRDSYVWFWVAWGYVPWMIRYVHRLLINDYTAGRIDYSLLIIQCIFVFTELKEANMDARAWIFQLLCKLGAVCFVGQRVLIMASDQFASVSERLCFVDPFEKNVCQVYNNVMFV